MRIFRHVTEVYTCTKCAHARSIDLPSLSAFSVVMVALATLPIWFAALREPWNFPWYCGAIIFAGELLVMFGAGFVAGIFFSFDVRGKTTCEHCNAPTFFAGRHFDPKGYRRPNWRDAGVTAVFLGLNVAIWFSAEFR